MVERYCEGMEQTTLQQPFHVQKYEDKKVKQKGNGMKDWKEETKELYFDKKLKINEIAERTGKSRQSISGYLKTLAAYQEEKEFRKNENQIKRKAYKREKNREYREAYRNRVTADTMKREHDIAVMLLSHEKYH